MSCIAPFLPAADYANSTGYKQGRFCSDTTGVECCLPCPLADWVYPDSFATLTNAADWVGVASTFCCVALLLSWIVLPVDKTNRHYLSICLTTAVLMLSLGFVIPLAGKPEQCADAITPHGMQSDSTCGASGSFLLLGGWAGVMWVFLRSLSLHLQICWQVVVGRTFMWASYFFGWGIPLLGMTLSLVFSGTSYRFGTTCHINHPHSLAVLWIPLLTFSGLTIIVQFVTFSYCIKVYLVSLADNTASTENSGLPSYTNSIRTMTPRQAYRRVRRVIQLQWRGIAIVLIIITDVIFFSIVFVFQDNTVAAVSRNPTKADDWLFCLAVHSSDKNQCLQFTSSFIVKEATIGAVLVLLAMNGIWLVFLLGRWSMVLGWIDLVRPEAQPSNKREFVSVDARLDDLKKGTRAYEMLSRDFSSSTKSPGPVITTTTTTSSILRKDQDIVTSPSSPTGATARTMPTASAMSPAAARSPSALSQRGFERGFDHVTPLSSVVARAGADSHFDGRFANRFDSPFDKEVDSLSALTDLNTTAAPSHSRYGSHSSSFTYNNNTTTISSGGAAAAAGAALPSGRRTPDYFGQTARYKAPVRSFSNSRPPTASSMNSPPSSSVRWDSRDSFGRAVSPAQVGTAVHTHNRLGSRNESRTRNGLGGGDDDDDDDDVDDASRHPLGINRI